MMGSVGRREKDPSSSESEQDSRSANSPHSPGLDRVVQARIGDKLRAMYGELTEQPVPDRLMSILDRLGKE
jgi:anti-sigma factor NepR-like protein